MTIKNGYGREKQYNDLELIGTKIKKMLLSGASILVGIQLFSSCYSIHTDNVMRFENKRQYDGVEKRVDEIEKQVSSNSKKIDSIENDVRNLEYRLRHEMTETRTIIKDSIENLAETINRKYESEIQKSKIDYNRGDEHLSPELRVNRERYFEDSDSETLSSNEMYERIKKKYPELEKIPANLKRAIRDFTRKYEDDFLIWLDYKYENKNSSSSKNDILCCRAYAISAERSLMLHPAYWFEDKKAIFGNPEIYFVDN